MSVPLLNFEGCPGVPLLNFGGCPGVPLLNFEGGPRCQGPGVLVPLLHHAVRHLGLKIWEPIPNNIKCSNFLTKFKKSIKSCELLCNFIITLLPLNKVIQLIQFNSIHSTGRGPNRKVNYQSKVVWDMINFTKSISSTKIIWPVVMTLVKVAKDKYISRWGDWENLINVREENYRI